MVEVEVDEVAPSLRWAIAKPERAANGSAKGNRVIVVGQLRARSWETPEGDKRTVVEVQAEEVGPSLRWATAKPERATGNGKPSGQFNDDPPF